jgi:hypothetical protein
MPHRLDEFRAKIQFVTNAEMPSDIYEACKRTGIVSQTRYCQEAVAKQLSQDLDIPLDDLLARLPECRTNAKTMLSSRVAPRVGPSGSFEEVL